MPIFIRGECSFGANFIRGSVHLRQLFIRCKLYSSHISFEAAIIRGNFIRGQPPLEANFIRGRSHSRQMPLEANPFEANPTRGNAHSMPPHPPNTPPIRDNFPCDALPIRGTPPPSVESLPPQPHSMLGRVAQATQAGVSQPGPKAPDGPPEKKQ